MHSLCASKALVFKTAFHRYSVGGSLIGSIAETQEVLDICAEHGIGPEIEIIDIAEVNDAYARVEKGAGAVPLRDRYGDADAGLRARRGAGLAKDFFVAAP